MTQLYIIAQEYKDAADKLADLDLDAQTIADTLEGLAGDLEQKATATAMVIRNMDSLAAQIKEAEAELSKRRKSLESRAQSLTKYLRDCMIHSGRDLIESPHFAIKIKKNPPHVVIDSPEMIPAEFMKAPPPPPPSIDKVAIKEALKSGAEVPGARIEQELRLEIK